VYPSSPMSFGRWVNVSGLPHAYRAKAEYDGETVTWTCSGRRNASRINPGLSEVSRIEQHSPLLPVRWREARRLARSPRRR
jgi:hypothetical protein